MGVAEEDVETLIDLLKHSLWFPRAFVVKDAKKEIAEGSYD